MSPHQIVDEKVQVISLYPYYPYNSTLFLVCFIMFQREKAQVLLVYPLILLITWAQQVPMSHEYDLLLQTFLNNEGMDEAHLHHSVAEYFKASHGTTMLATGGRGDNSRVEDALTLTAHKVTKREQFSVLFVVYNCLLIVGAGHPLVEFLLTIIDHNQQLMAILSWSIDRWDAR